MPSPSPHGDSKLLGPIAQTALGLTDAVGE